MNRREFIATSIAGASLLQQHMTAFAASASDLRVEIDATRPGAPVAAAIFGGYMEPATTRVWAEMLTDRKFANPVTEEKASAAPTSPFFRFLGEPFRPVGPAGTVTMDTAQPFVGRHSPRVQLDASEPHGIRQSRLRLGRGKSYTGRVYLAGD
ncbi:MAG: hypothetical protein ACLGSH_12110, partial [Acidobacteriota bacterium]